MTVRDMVRFNILITVISLPKKKFERLAAGNLFKELIQYHQTFLLLKA
jgi:hypothetical protein